MVATELDKRTDEERATLEALEQRLQQGLLDFVRNGKGLIGVQNHGSPVSFRKVQIRKVDAQALKKV